MDQKLKLKDQGRFYKQLKSQSHSTVFEHYSINLQYIKLLYLQWQFIHRQATYEKEGEIALLMFSKMLRKELIVR